VGYYVPAGIGNFSGRSTAAQSITAFENRENSGNWPGIPGKVGILQVEVAPKIPAEFPLIPAKFPIFKSRDPLPPNGLERKIPDSFFLLGGREGV
jgi:hypothetical protein